jgi:hypothetical protein
MSLIPVVFICQMKAIGKEVDVGGCGNVLKE